jgi:SAM-dependent MidA family methyltransferase
VMHSDFATLFAEASIGRLGLTFAEFMHLALYHPKLGYYQQKNFTIGENADFTTAPELSDDFARCLARQIAAIQKQIGAYDLVEFGPGTGKLAKDLHMALKNEDALPQHYYAVEISKSLAERQQKLLQPIFTDMALPSSWSQEYPKKARKAIIIANEVLDAMPVHLCSIREEGAVLRGVCLVEGCLQMMDYPDVDKSLQKQLDVLALRCKAPYQTELNVNIKPWLQGMAKHCQQAVLLIVDYGYAAAEYYHPQRSNGTLRAYKSQQLQTDILKYPGEQDLTAHVNFTAVVEAADTLGFELLGFTSQADFLLQTGLFAEGNYGKAFNVQDFQRAQAMKMLTLPQEMGELMKIMALGIGLPDLQPLLGFCGSDLSYQL